MASADRERGPGRSLPESKRVEAFAQLKRAQKAAQGACRSIFRPSGGHILPPWRQGPSAALEQEGTCTLSAPPPCPCLWTPMSRLRIQKVSQLASLVEVTTRMMNQTSWQVRPMNAGLRNLAIATCRFCTEPTVQLSHAHLTYCILPDRPLQGIALTRSPFLPTCTCMTAYERAPFSPLFWAPLAQGAKILTREIWVRPT